MKTVDNQICYFPLNSLTMISYFIHFTQKHPVSQFTDSQTSHHDMQETMSFLKLAIYLFPHEVETLVQESI